MLTTKQTSLLNKIANENGFTDYSVQVQEGSKRGDNYLGIILLITIKDKTQEKSLILKCADKSEDLRKQLPISKCYQREVFMYREVIPTLLKLQSNVSLPHPIKSFAKFYGSSLDVKEEFLLFDNLKSMGFHILDRKITMDHEHVETVIKELAKFHSLSFVLKLIQPETYTEYSKHLNDYFQDTTNQWMKTLKNQLCHAYKAAKDNINAFKIIKKCENGMTAMFEKSNAESLNLVIIHGDVWCNNILFKYHEPAASNPIELCFLDFQISKIGSPAYDLCYFLFLSVSEEVFDNHKKYLLLYHKIIEENLRSIGHNIQNIFSFDQLLHHWNIFCKVVFFITIGNMQFLLKDEGDIQTLSEMAECGRSIIDNFYSIDGHSEMFYKRISNIMSMLIKYDYL